MIREAIEEELKVINERSVIQYTTTYWKGNATIFKGDDMFCRLDGKPEMTEDESFLNILLGSLRALIDSNEKRV